MDIFVCISELVSERQHFRKRIGSIFSKIMIIKRKYNKHLKATVTSEEVTEEQVQTVRTNVTKTIDEIEECKHSFNNLTEQLKQKIEVLQVQLILRKAEHYKVFMDL